MMQWLDWATETQIKLIISVVTVTINHWYTNHYTHIYLLCRGTRARTLTQCINPPGLTPLGISAWGIVPPFPYNRFGVPYEIIHQIWFIF